MAEIPIGRATIIYYETGLPVPTTTIFFPVETRKRSWWLVGGLNVERNEVLPYPLSPGEWAGGVIPAHHYSTATVATYMKYPSDAKKPLRFEVYSIIAPYLVSVPAAEIIGKIVDHPIYLQTLPFSPGAEIISVATFTNPTERFMPVIINQNTDVSVDMWMKIYGSKDPVPELPMLETWVRDADLTAPQEVILFTEGKKQLEVYATSDVATNFYLDVAKTERLTYTSTTYPAEWRNWYSWSGVTEVKEFFFNGWRMVRFRSDPAGSAGDKVTLILTAK